MGRGVRGVRDVGCRRRRSLAVGVAGVGGSSWGCVVRWSWRRAAELAPALASQPRELCHFKSSTPTTTSHKHTMSSPRDTQRQFWSVPHRPSTLDRIANNNFSPPEKRKPAPPPPKMKPLKRTPRMRQTRLSFAKAKEVDTDEDSDVPLCSSPAKQRKVVVDSDDDVPLCSSPVKTRKKGVGSEGNSVQISTRKGRGGTEVITLDTTDEDEVVLPSSARRRRRETVEHDTPRAKRREVGQEAEGDGREEPQREASFAVVVEAPRKRLRVSSSSPKQGPATPRRRLQKQLVSSEEESDAPLASARRRLRHPHKEDTEEEDTQPPSARRRAKLTSEDAEEEEEEEEKEDTQPRSARRRRLKRPVQEETEEGGSSNDDLEILPPAAEEESQGLGDDIRLAAKTPKTKTRTRFAGSSPGLTPYQLKLRALKAKREGGTALRTSSSAKKKALYDTDNSNDESEAGSESEPEAASGSEAPDSEADLNEWELFHRPGSPSQESWIVSDSEASAPLGAPDPDAGIPLEFTSASHQSYKDSFFTYTHYLCLILLCPGIPTDAHTTLALRRLESQVQGYTTSILTSSIWTPRIVRAMAARPVFVSEKCPARESCDACRRDRHSVRRVRFIGKRYDPETLRDYDEDEDYDSEAWREEDLPLENEWFYLGSSCHQRSELRHAFIHWKIHLRDQIEAELAARKLIDEEGNVKSSVEKMGAEDRERWAVDKADAMMPVAEGFYRDFKKALDKAQGNMAGQRAGFRYTGRR